MKDKRISFIAHRIETDKNVWSFDAKFDGYCYAHHPSVVLAKLRLYARSGLPYLRNYQLAGPDMPIQAEIEKQEALLSTLPPR